VPPLHSRRENPLETAQNDGNGLHRAVSYLRPILRARLVIGSCLNPLASPPAADRVLVLRLGAVGDVVRTLPAVARLRAGQPGAHIAWLVEPAAASLLEGQPCVDEVLVFPREAIVGKLRRGAVWGALRDLGDFTRRLRRRRFDLVVDFHSILRSALLALLSGSRRRLGYARPFGRELSWLFATHRARLTPQRISRFDRNAALVEYLGLPAGALSAPLRVDPRAQARLRKRLPSGPAPVAIHAGTSAATPHKRYPVEGYAQVARQLAKEDGVPCIATWGPARDDRRLAEALVAASAGAVQLAPETRSLADLAALLSGCRLTLGNDSGPLHVSSLVGTPVVQLLGPTDPIENAPWEATPSRTLGPAASSGGRDGEDVAGDPGGIAPGRIYDAVRELLGEAREAGAPPAATGAGQ
jgi:ADP-heptose:LPS heptosyltransferase